MCFFFDTQSGSENNRVVDHADEMMQKETKAFWRTVGWNDTSGAISDSVLSRGLSRGSPGKKTQKSVLK